MLFKQELLARQSQTQLCHIPNSQLPGIPIFWMWLHASQATAVQNEVNSLQCEQKINEVITERDTPDFPIKQTV